MTELNEIANIDFIDMLTSSSWWGILIGIITMFACTSLIKWLLFIKKQNLKIIEIPKWLLWIISPDYQLSNLYKDKLKEKGDNQNKDQLEEENARAEYICRNNIWNLVISGGLVVVVLLLAYLTRNYWLWAFLSGFLGYRILSRTVEINLAFFNDVCDKLENKSNLSPQKRIRLAIKSLIEEVFLFFGIYALMSGDFSWSFIGIAMMAGAKSFIPSIPEVSCSFVALVGAYQAICSVILITLSIASYISRQSTYNSDEKAKESTPNSNDGEV